MNKLFLDTESCGLTGPIVLIQYTCDTGDLISDNKVIIYEVWKHTIKETLELLERICEYNVVGFNLVHDWFHVNKLYNLFRAQTDTKAYPSIGEIARVSSFNNTVCCLKPKSSLDLYLFAKKGPWQVLMDRKPIKIRKVPIELAKPLADILHKRLQFPDILFARSQQGYKWKVKVDKKNPRFANISLRFAPSSALKILCREMFKIPVIEFPIPRELFPIEVSYNPYTTDWTRVIQYHIDYWATNKNARSYAEQDVILLQRLDDAFGTPEGGDDDSILACCVGAVRWAGFAINPVKIAEQYVESVDSIREGLKFTDNSTVNINAPAQVLQYLREVATDNEKLVLKDTSKDTLNIVKEWDTKENSNACGKRAKDIIRVRKTTKRITILEGLFNTKRFNPVFRIIGTKSGRMSGGDFRRTKGSINPQGIQKSTIFRSLFTLFDPGYTLSGGDFKAQEVTIADAVYNDQQLRADLLSGKKIHGVMGEFLYDKTYEEVLSSQGSSKDLYSPSKNVIFALFYGAQEFKVSKTAVVPIEKARLAYRQITERYPRLGLIRQQIFDAFTCLRQPAGIGTEIIWTEPHEYIESLYGFRRYFTLENSIIKTLHDLASDLPKELESMGRVIRRDREQTPRGAVQSALFAAAFLIQAQNMRAAGNHVIQSTGAQVTKKLQRAIWDIQPQGVHEWYVKPMNVHDEVMVVHKPESTEQLNTVVKDVIEESRKTVPLLDIEWKNNLENWGAK